MKKIWATEEDDLIIKLHVEETSVKEISETISSNMDSTQKKVKSLGLSRETKLEIGSKYGRLTVVGKSNVPTGKGIYYDFSCECGNIVSRPARNIKKFTCRTSCGIGKCSDVKEYDNHSGKVVGHMHIKSFDQKTRSYECECTKCKSPSFFVTRHLINKYVEKNSYHHSCELIPPIRRKHQITEEEKKDIIDTTIGRLKVLDCKNNLFICKCSCGNIVERSLKKIQYLRRMEYVVRCDKNCKDRTLETREKKLSDGIIPISYFNGVATNARKRNKEFSVTIEYLSELLKNQKYKCALSGLPIGFDSYWENPKDRKGSVASLDRIDSKIGYVEGNVQWLHKDVNWIKQDLIQEEFLRYCSDISENSKNE